MPLISSTATPWFLAGGAVAAAFLRVFRFCAPPCGGGAGQSATVAQGQTECMGCSETKTGEIVDETLANSGLLLDKYDLHEVIGQGAFGVVHRARLKDGSKDFAVKMVDCVESSRSDIDREVAMMRKCAHDAIVRIYDIFPEKVFVCLVMELHSGGDMIQGMCAHWKKHGMIPIAAMRSLSKQMWDAVAVVHSRNCVHRDIKGDNFMMDKKDIADISNRIYLSDFGTVCDIEPGERLSGKCGTSNYWSPEFFNLNYSQKVDVWATGVVMYGLSSGKFPFKSEKDVRAKKLVVPDRCPPDGRELIHAALERREDLRLEASVALHHPFFEALSAPSPDPAVDEAQRLGFFSSDQVRERGANGGVQQRRADLVARLKLAKRGRQRRQIYSFARVKDVKDRSFVVDSMCSGERQMTYQWWSAEEAAGICAGFEQTPQMQDTNIQPSEFSVEDIAKLLKDHNVPTERFGQDGARSFEEFVADLRAGHLRLQLDASKHKHIVCVVEVVLLQLQFGDGADAKYLVHASEKESASWRRTDVWQLPRMERKPHESALQTARRLQAELKLEDVRVEFNLQGMERSEEIVESPSYPGIRLVYLADTMIGTVVADSIGDAGHPRVLANFSLEDSQRRRNSYSWLSSIECGRLGLQVPAQRKGGYSTLIYPPVGLEEDELLRYLETNQVDTSSWGTGTARSVHDFADELAKGEATLQKMPDGKIKRVVDIVVLKLVSDKGVVVELEETAQACKQELKRFPAVKRRTDEHQFLAARRMVAQNLSLDENYVEIDPSVVRVVEEETPSVSYPGIPSVYRKRFITARLVREVFLSGPL